MTSTPDALFLANGGSALLAAHGVDGEASLKSYFSRRFQVIPKAGEPLRDGATSLPTPMSGFATLLVWQGGMHLFVNTTPGVAVPGVVVERFIGQHDLPAIAARALDLPRPLMLLTVGPSYGPDLGRAVVSIDPDLILISGKVEAVLDRDRIERIRKACSHYGCRPEHLLRLAKQYELSWADEREPLYSPRAVREVARFGKAIGRAFSSEDALRLWANIDQMPAASDLAWQAIPHLKTAA